MFPTIVGGYRPRPPVSYAYGTSQICPIKVKSHFVSFSSLACVQIVAFQAFLPTVHKLRRLFNAQASILNRNLSDKNLNFCYYMEYIGIIAVCWWNLWYLYSTKHFYRKWPSFYTGSLSILLRRIPISIEQKLKIIETIQLTFVCLWQHSMAKFCVWLLVGTWLKFSLRVRFTSLIVGK